MTSHRSFLPRPLSIYGVAALALLLTADATVLAHELGTTVVAIGFPSDRTYAVAITTDASALLARLELARREPRTSPDSAAAYQQRFDLLCADVVEHVSLTFDGVTANGSASCAVDTVDAAAAADPSALGVTVTLAGAVPDGVGSFRWRYDLTGTSYTLTIPGPDGTTITGPLEGGQQSSPYTVRRGPAALSRTQAARAAFAMGFTEILPKGLEHVLYLLGATLWIGGQRGRLPVAIAMVVGQVIILGLISAGAISASPGIVEPLMALSLAYVAIETILGGRLNVSRGLLVWGFGLIHAVGVAGVLHDQTFLLDRSAAGLMAFNAGLEVGQLAVVGLALVIAGGSTTRSASFRQLVVVPGSTLLVIAAVIRTIECL
jgi:HupE / UreJ protein